MQLGRMIVEGLAAILVLDLEGMQQTGAGEDAFKG